MHANRFRSGWVVLIALSLTACASETPVAVQSAPTLSLAETTTLTPPPQAAAVSSPTPAPSASATTELKPTATATATATHQPVNTLTSTAVPASPTSQSEAAITPTAALPASTSEPSPAATTASAPLPANPPPVVDATLEPPPDSGSCGKYPCADDIGGWEARLRVPPGFSAKHLVTVNGHPTSLTYAPDGRLVVATMEGTLLAYDMAGTASTIASGFNLPIGVAYRPGTSDLYVASRTLPRDVFPNEGKVTIVHADGSQQDIVTGLPCCYTSDMHQPNSLAFGPDGKVYLSIGAHSDHGEKPGQPDVFGEIDPLEAGILRFDADGSELERYAAGLRNPYDLAFDANGRLYATDNGPDFGPPDRLLRIVQGAHYGYPYYANCDNCPPAPPDLKITPPLATFIPHAAATGITAYTGSQFPANYATNLFVTLWSGFPGAQKVMRIQLSPFKMSDFVLGLADPIDVTVAPDGALVVADWVNGNVFKISYAP